MDGEIIAGIIGALLTFVVALIKRKEDKRKIELEIENLELENNKLKKENEEKLQKLGFYDDVIKLVFYNAINDAVQSIFSKTKVDRFLILIARNGKTTFNYVDVMLEFHKSPQTDIHAVKVYKNVEIDDQYRKMLKDTEYYGFVDLETFKMETQILKHYYQTEKVTYSRVKSALRMPIDEGNDFLVFTSSATHEKENFNDLEKTIIDQLHNSIIKPSIKSLLDEK